MTVSYQCMQGGKQTLLMSAQCHQHSTPGPHAACAGNQLQLQFHAQSLVKQCRSCSRSSCGLQLGAQ